MQGVDTRTGCGDPPCASSFRMGSGDCSGVTVPGVEDREEAREMTEAILPSLVACHEGRRLCQAGGRSEVTPGWTCHAPCGAEGEGRANAANPHLEAHRSPERASPWL